MIPILKAQEIRNGWFCFLGGVFFFFSPFWFCFPFPFSAEGSGLSLRLLSSGPSGAACFIPLCFPEKPSLGCFLGLIISEKICFCLIGFACVLYHPSQQWCVWIFKSIQEMIDLRLIKTVMKLLLPSKFVWFRMEILYTGDERNMIGNCIC